MAKRKKLETPSAEDLSRYEDEFRHETDGLMIRGGGVPIAQVSGDAAQHIQTATTEARAAQAKIAADANDLREAKETGLLMVALPLAQIDADAMVRDRMDLGEDDMSELRQSIAANGLRLPIEVFELPNDDLGPRYSLVSGYRRFIAVKSLHQTSGDLKYATIRAIVRPRAEADVAFVAMVEENEVRAQLTPYERGRIAVISAQQGAFANVEDAVNRLYATASKAKRSKVRSFAAIFETLGDLLAFPESLSEKRGLRLAQALRSGSDAELRDALARRVPENCEQEWATVESVIANTGDFQRDKRRGGRPAKSDALGWQGANFLRTSAGITIRKTRDDHGFTLRLEGSNLNDDLMESLMVEIQAMLEKP